MNITLEKYIKILDAGYSLDILYLLKLIKEGVDLTEEILHPKIAAINQMLLRKALVSEQKVTMTGDQLLAYLDTEEVKNVKLVKIIKAADFDKWWEIFPATNTFVYKGKTFTGSRSLRQKKADCKLLFAKHLNEGMKSEDIIGGTEYHMQIAKEESFKKGDNKLTYIASSERYLREKMFEPYIELYKKASHKEEIEYDGVNI